MRLLLLAIAAIFLAIAPIPAFAVPGAPESIWFEGNASLHYSNGNFSANWTAVSNEAISNYVVHIINSKTKATIRVFVSTGPDIRGIIFSGTNGINYTFKVSAVNTDGIPGPNATSDWISVDTLPPNIRYAPPTPENGTYLKNATITMLLSSSEPLSSVFLRLNGVEEPANVTYEGWGSGTYYYYVDRQLPLEDRYFYSFWANDSAGNRAITETRLATYDLTPPLVTIFSPQNKTYNTTRIYLNYTVYDVSPVMCQYAYNATIAPLQNCANTTFRVSDNETANLELWALDAAGNAAIETVDFFAKEPPIPPPPVISSEYPQNNTAMYPPSFMGSNITLIAVITDDVAVCKYSFVSNISFKNMTAVFNQTNSTVHISEITIWENRSYTVHVRCKSEGGMANNEDYTFGFRVKPFFNALIIDPDRLLLDNGTIAIELVKSKAVLVNITLANEALYNLLRLNSSVTGSGAQFINITLPASIKANSTAEIGLSISSPATGNFTASINVTASPFSAKFKVLFTVYEDYMPDLSSLRIMRQGIFTRIYDLSSKGVDVAGMMQESDRLQSDINDAYSMYNSGDYGSGRALYLSIKSDVKTLGESVTNAEALYAESIADNISDDNITLDPIIEPDNATGIEPEAGGKRNIGAIIIAIFLVIAAAFVLATSVVPDDEESRPKRQRRFSSEEA